MICPCGVNIKEYPHLTEICAPTLPGRLLKMAEYIDIKKHNNISLSDVSYIYIQNHKNIFLVTAFPTLRANYKGCVYCGCEIEYWLRICVGKYNAYLCPPCFKQDRRLCPVTMGCKDICIQRNNAILKESSLCILRCARLSLDLRRLLYSWIKKTCTCLH